MDFPSSFPLIKLSPGHKLNDNFTFSKDENPSRF